MLLLALPILSSIPYILALFRPATFLIALLGLSSLTSTAFLLISLPATETGIPLLDAWARAPDYSPVLAAGDDPDQLDESSDSGSGGWWGLGGSGREGGPSGLGTLDRRRRRRRRTNSLTYEVPKSPLERHLPFLNMGLCAILILFGLNAAHAESEHNPGDHDAHVNHHNFGWLGLGNLPAIVYAVVIIAKVVMASVDPERELAALKYGYKGA